MYVNSITTNVGALYQQVDNAGLLDVKELVPEGIQLFQGLPHGAF